MSAEDEETFQYLMYEFHYKYFKKKFRVDLLFTDTDNLVHKIETDDAYEDFHENKNLFDFSDYPQDWNFFDPANKKSYWQKDRWI